jgi:hypothetical protein
MSNSPDLVAYRSADPEVVRAWTGAADGINDYVKATQAVLDAAGLGQYKVYRHNGWSPGQFAGLAIPAGETAPTGWRMLRDYAVPDRRLKAGKTIDAAIAAVKHPGDPLHKLVGMPPDMLTGGRFLTPGVRLLEDRSALYVTWRADPAGSESFFSGRAEIDLGRWERVPLSRYYAAVEEADRQAADAATAKPQVRECARCLRVLVGEDESGWYYQSPESDPEAPGLTFMGRVHECDGKPHEVRLR